MLREIHEQPQALAATLRRYAGGGRLDAAACGPIRQWLGAARDGIVIAASGSSRHAALAGEVLIEDASGLAVDVEYASEYAYRPEQALKQVPVLVVSQSGETADTLAALRRANAVAPTLAVTNVAGSSMDREAAVSFPTEAGFERAIPATKSFTAQLLNFWFLALMAAEARGRISERELSARLETLAELPHQVERQLPGWTASLRAIADAYGSARNFLFLGRGVHYPIAREGALKLKESAYLSAEGYPGGELRHGPNALVSQESCVVILATVDRSDPESRTRYEKTLQLMRELRQREARILAIANAGDAEAAAACSHLVAVEEAAEPLLAICEVIPLQLFACFMAVSQGINPDQPRNLSKAVLVE